MTEVEKREAATKFYNDWHGKGDEKSDSQRFWIEFFSNVLGIENVTQKIIFEKRVIIDAQTKFIDLYIPETRVLIEQKSITKELDQKIPQSGGLMMTPFEQGRNYAHWMLPDETPLWIVACNFKSFEIHDMKKPQEAPVIITLDDVRDKISQFDFMFRKEVKELSHEMEISVKAGEIVGILYDKLLSQYIDPNEESLKSLNALCVRLVFCLYAEDAGIFGSKMMFHDYLEPMPVTGIRKALVELFKILDTKIEHRDKYLAEDNPSLAAFPYVNGGLFADETIEIPPFNEEIKDLLLIKASADFDWNDISPTIFGAVFESTLNPETRRSGGMHYTSIENIHKVIDPLFLSDLTDELESIKKISVVKTRKSKLQEYREKLSKINFLDPACGSGNFLTETYISIRRLENEALKAFSDGQISFGDETYNPILVSIGQFYGIEVNDFAVTVAKTALWIAESQMLKETEDVVHMTINFLPLKSYANIIEGNALQVDWNEVVPIMQLNYIMGNPPFIGKKYQTPSQKNDMKSVFGTKQKGIGNLDYVTAWYKRAASYMKNTKISTAFVSTNSIVQGEHVPLFWKPLYNEYPITIDFAYQTFKWNSEAKEKAAVHCVIIGFSLATTTGKKKLYTHEVPDLVENIHPYLLSMPNIFIDNRSKPLFDVNPLVYGSFALDDGNYTISESEYNDILKKEPEISKYLKLFIGSEEFINNKKRYCVWLKNADIREIRSSKILSSKIDNVQKWRSQSGRKETVSASETPMLFAENRQPESDYLAIPITSSERRRYIPIGYMSKEVIASNHLLVLPNATLYEFGVLTSNVHMAWMRTVAGRLKSDYNYSARIVYNNFPWCDPTDEQKLFIEQTAQSILDARNMHPEYTLSELYDPRYMPEELKNAHNANNRAVMKAYGFSIKDFTEADCVSLLMEMYQNKINV